MATRERTIVRDGVVEGYFLGSYSARKLGMKTTGNAGGHHNLFVRLGRARLSPACCKQMGRGLLVTELMGQGVNLVTGDYSRGAAGYWVEDGEIRFPVEEITIAGNLRRDVRRDRRHRQRRPGAQRPLVRLDPDREHDRRGGLEPERRRLATNQPRAYCLTSMVACTHDEFPRPPKDEHPIVAILAVVAIVAAIVLIMWARVALHGTEDIEATFTDGPLTQRYRRATRARRRGHVEPVRGRHLAAINPQA